MAFPTLIPSQNLSFHLSPSFFSRRNILKINAHLSSDTLQPSNDEEQSPQLEPPTDSIEFNTTKKKKKKKLRPSFYDQTLERWSLKVSSQRSKLPWEEQQDAEKKKQIGSLLSGSPSSQIFNNSRATRLDSVLIVENPEENVEFKAENPPSIAKFDFSLGIRMGNARAPWVHDARSRESHLEYKDDSLTSNEGLTSDEEDENRWGFLSNKYLQSSSNSNKRNVNVEELSNCNTMDEMPPICHEKIINSIPNHKVTRHNSLESLELGVDSEGSSVSLIVDQLRNSLSQNNSSSDVDSSTTDKTENGFLSNSDRNVVKLTSSVPFPWERNHSEKLYLSKRSNTEFAEKTIPEPELQRLRNVALRMKERMKVGAAGVTEALVQSIHKKWKVDEVVKLRFEGPPTLNMKRTHEILETRTGGIVIWRSGSSLVLYRGMAYKLPCVQSYAKLADVDHSENSLKDSSVRASTTSDVGTSNSANSSEGSTGDLDVDSFLDQLGPRYKDWSGCNPLPVDADMLPGVVSGYEPPSRLLPYKTRSKLNNRQMTALRRLARTMTPHFALGRNRQHQGLARAVVKLWEKSSIAKIAIKRGVLNTCNERMAEELKKLTGGVLVSRNKEYIVFYRGNDFLTPSVREVIVESQKLATLQQDEEEEARLRASASIVSNAKTAKAPFLAGTLSETLEAKSRWGDQPTTGDIQKMRTNLVLAEHASLVRYLERKLAFAKAKVRKAERALAKVQEFLTPSGLPTDLEIVTDEERTLFRQMGLKMRAYLLLGRRGVFDGTIENMHLNWKHRELVKVLIKGKSFAQVKHIAISLEAESGGVLISLDKTTKGYAIVIYRGKNYHRPHTLRPKNLLTRRQALARSIELQRREALNHHIAYLHEKVQMLKSQLDIMQADKQLGNEHLDIKMDGNISSDDDLEDEGEEAYLETYCSGDEN